MVLYLTSSPAGGQGSILRRTCYIKKPFLNKDRQIQFVYEVVKNFRGNICRKTAGCLLRFIRSSLLIPPKSLVLCQQMSAGLSK